MNTKAYTIPFNKVRLSDIALVGGKNASLGEMTQQLGKSGIRVPEGFAITSQAYWDLLDENNIRENLNKMLEKLDLQNFSNLAEISRSARQLVLSTKISPAIQDAIKRAYQKLVKNSKQPIEVAVRSSATAEDLPSASFAGQQETYLNISGEQALLEACQKCFASLFTERAIKYRTDHGFDHMKVALSVGVQRMVRSDKGCSGVAFTLEPETGFKDVIVIDGIWGLGENIVQGIVDPDEFIVFKPSLKKQKRSIISKKTGKKHLTMVYASEKDGSSIVNLDTSVERQKQLVLGDEEVTELAKWCQLIEDHYKTPMDIEWAKDGLTNELYIVQARPETVHTIKDPHIIYSYHLKEKGKVLTKGVGLGNKIAFGKARILNDPSEADKLQSGDVLVTDITNPDWDPIMKKVAAIVTNKGGRTSHAAIVARELGVVAVVGTGNATTAIQDGQIATVSCAEGKEGIIYDGKLNWEEHTIDTRKVKLPKTEAMFILADPGKAFQYSFLPNNGIGLMRMEFVINNIIRVHPMALVHFDKVEDKADRKKIEELTEGYENKEHYFIDQLSQAVATAAAAFYPKDVIVRMSDFKSNEYANLIGGRPFEPEEENPMIGLRGASRYYSPLYKEGFRLECEAMKIVQDEMGLTNVKLMIPFCRTVEEGKKVVDLMAQYGLARGENGLEIYTMIEIPSNVLLAEKFAEVFDGFSIGSNDLTQLTLGLDRDSGLVSGLFDENNEAVKQLISGVIRSAKKTGTKIGLCGQAPSDFPEFASFLVEEGIDSISFNPDAMIKGINNIQVAELKHKEK
ncbi:phosphoenolpyruvate synthase [Reichenbachiella sp. MALMAid0571]|uniref:phosphoenolpyruvate synthase n=1 Tax=Reichenbachiella sp. MALMAid0571 TaxID=3143939 RepID=UPI0032E00923